MYLVGHGSQEKDALLQTLNGFAMLDGGYQQRRIRGRDYDENYLQDVQQAEWSDSSEEDDQCSS